MRLPLVGLTAMVAVALAASGCGSSNSTSGSATANPAAATVASGKHYSIGIVGFSSADPTSTAAIKGYEAVAAQRGWHVTFVDPQGSPDKAVAAMQNLVQKHVDLIVTVVFPANSLAAGALAAKQANIPVVSLSGGTGPGVEVNYDAGNLQGREIAQKLIAETGGKGDLLILGYKSGLPCIEREQQLDKTIASAQFTRTREEVPIPGQVAAGTQFAQAWLARHPASGQQMSVWACFDDPAIGAITAIQQAGRSRIRVYGVNGTPQALEAIKSGRMTATVYLDAYGAGKQMAQNTPKYVSDGVGAAPINSPIPSVLVDKANLASFEARYPGALKGQ